MESLTTGDLAGAVLVGNLCTIAVIYVFWRAHKDWKNFGIRDAIPLFLPLLLVSYVFY